MGAAAAVAAGGEPAAGECFEPAAAAAAIGEPEDDEECLEPAVAEGAGGESEAEEDCDIAEPAPRGLPEIRRRAAQSAGGSPRAVDSAGSGHTKAYMATTFRMMKSLLVVDEGHNLDLTRLGPSKALTVSRLGVVTLPRKRWAPLI